jgi:hypothetical protein
MSKVTEAIDVLERAQSQLIGEIATCGNSGGIGRAQNYAPSLVNVTDALEALRKIVENHSGPTPEQIRMAAVRAAKQQKSD